MTSSPSATTEDVPAPASIGLALAVVRSKPPEKTIDEHLDLVVNSIGGTLSAFSHGPPPHLDSDAYWRSEYQRANAEKAALEDEVIQLRDQLKRIKQPTRATQKRKPESQTTAKANTQSKRRRVDDDTDGSNEGAVLEMDEAQEPGIKNLLRAFIQLQQLTNSDLPSPNDLRIRLSRLCNALSGVLIHDEELSSRMPAIYCCMVNTLRLLYDLHGHEGASFKACCSNIVRFFQYLLGHFHQTALNEVARRERNEERRSKKPKSNSKAVKSAAPEAEQQCKMRLQAQVKIISAMFRAIDATNKADNLLCEGLIATLFDHIGSSLSLLVFMDPESKDQGIEPVTGLLDVAHIEPESAIATAELCAPYLISMLRTALSVVRKSSTSTNSHTWKQSNSSLTSLPAEEALSHRVEVRLQHTLLRGVFGDDDTMFEHAFPRAEEEESQEVQEVIPDVDSEANSTNWFIGQVWELLGWDVLSGRVARTRASAT